MNIQPNENQTDASLPAIDQAQARLDDLLDELCPERDQKTTIAARRFLISLQITLDDGQNKMLSSLLNLLAAFHDNEGEEPEIDDDFPMELEYDDWRHVHTTDLDGNEQEYMI